MDQMLAPQVIANLPMIDGDVMRLTQGNRLLPYIADHVYCNYGKNFFTTFAEAWMDKKYQSDTDVWHVEENGQIYKIKVLTTVQAASAGAQAVVAYASNVIGSFNQVQPGYFVGVPPIGKLAKIISVNPTAKTFVIEPNDITYRIQITAGEELIIIPAAIVAACSCEETPSSTKLPGLLYKSKMMIIKKTKKICGEDLAKWLQSRTLFPLMDLNDPCKEVQVWWHADLDQMWYEFMLAKQILGLLGDDITNNTANFTNLKSTTGVMPMLRTRATQEPVAAATGITIDYFKRIGMKLKRIRNYCNQYGVWQGAEHRSQVDTALEGKVTKNDISWNFMKGDGPRGIEFGFDGLKLDSIEYYFHDEASLNDPGFLGAEGFNGPNTSFMIPLCKLVCGNQKTTPLVINYLAGNGINRELIENDFGILRPGSMNSNCDYHEWELMSEFGMDAYCLNTWIFTESI